MNKEFCEEAGSGPCLYIDTNDALAQDTAKPHVSPRVVLATFTSSQEVILLVLNFKTRMRKALLIMSRKHLFLADDQTNPFCSLSFGIQARFEECQ